MANISTDNINTLAQLASSLDDGDYIYVFKNGASAFSRIEKSVFMQGMSGGGDGGTNETTIANVNTLQAKIDEIISKLANYALSSEVLPVGTLDWGESGGGGDEPIVQTPVLTSPTNNSSYNIGEIESDGTSVSKQIYIKGSNLTQPLTIAIVGTGLSVSTNEVTASQANSGVYVTITYTNSTSGAASTSGTLTISSNELSNNVVVSLAASKAAEEVVVDDYITNRLVFHLDGKNQGGVSGKWIDSVGQKEFILEGSPVVGSNGIGFFNESDRGSYFSDIGLIWPHSDYTIEVCFTPASGFITDTNRVLFGNRREGGVAAVFSRPSASNQGWAFGVYSKNDNYGTNDGNASKRAWSGQQIVGLCKLSMNNDLMLFNGVADISTPTNTKLGVIKESTGAQLTVGGMLRENEGTGDATFFANATIHEVRIYDRKLSQAEMEHNQQVDDSRYN